jgi:hypothetical protein
LPLRAGGLLMRQTARALGQLDVFILGDLADFRGDEMNARRTGVLSPRGATSALVNGCSRASIRAAR